MKRVYFVRHGEAEGNSGGFSQTPTTPLTEKGKEQAQVVAKRFTSLPIEHVFASTMDRAQETAAAIAAEKGLTVETSEYFHEWLKPTTVQGASYESEAYKTYMAAEKAEYTNPDWRYEDGENFADILQRVSEGVAMLEEHEGKELVVVSHGRLLRFLTSFLLHKKQLTAETEQLTSISMQAVNTGITLFTYEKGEWKLVTWNDCAHFAQ